MAIGLADNEVAQFETERYDRAFGFKTNADGTKEAVVLSVEDAEKLGDKFVGQAVTVQVNFPRTLDGLVAMCEQEYKDDDGNVRSVDDVKKEAIKLFNSGASVKVANRLKALLTRTKEDGTLAFSDADTVNGEGNIVDMTDSILSGSKRVFKSLAQKTWDSLSNLPLETRKRMYDIFLTSTGGTPGVYPAE